MVHSQPRKKVLGGLIRLDESYLDLLVNDVHSLMLELAAVVRSFPSERWESDGIKLGDESADSKKGSQRFMSMGN